MADGISLRFDWVGGPKFRLRTIAIQKLQAKIWNLEFISIATLVWPRGAGVPVEEATSLFRYVPVRTQHELRVT
jgi:hypothetical protein